MHIRAVSLHEDEQEGSCSAALAEQCNGSIGQDETSGDIGWIHAVWIAGEDRIVL